MEENFSNHLYIFGFKLEFYTKSTLWKYRNYFAIIKKNFINEIMYALILEHL